MHSSGGHTGGVAGSHPPRDLADAGAAAMAARQHRDDGHQDIGSTDLIGIVIGISLYFTDHYQYLIHLELLNTCFNWYSYHCCIGTYQSVFL